MAIIETRGLTKTYGQSRGISDVDLVVNEGEIYGFIGPNGAGKSTTIKLLLNLIFPTSGSATLFGLDVVKDSEQIKRKVGYVPGEVRYYPHMTANELLRTTLAFHGQTSSEEMDRLCEMFEIEREKKLGAMSLGNKKKVAIAAALVHSPQLLILDEPTNGLDPLMQKRLFATLAQRAEAGATVFLSSHNLSEVQAHCTKAAFIKEGRIIRIDDLSVGRRYSKMVTITADLPIESALIERIGGKGITVNGQTTSFVYDGQANELMRLLAELQLKDVLIENSSLESEFLSYYEGGSEQ